MAMNSGSEENVTYRSVDEIGIDSPSKKEQDSQALIDSIVRVGAVLHCIMYGALSLTGALSRSLCVPTCV